MSNTPSDRLAQARTYAAQCIRDEAHALSELIGQLDENFDHAVEMIYHCRGKVIVTGDRDTPIDEYAVLWIDTVPELDENGALKVNADGEIVTPWDYIVRKVGRGLPNYGSTVIAISKVTVA